MEVRQYRITLRKRVHGEEHPLVATGMRNLARVLFQQKKLAQEFHRVSGQQNALVEALGEKVH